MSGLILSNVPAWAAPPDGGLAGLEGRVKTIWGSENAWLPRATVWVRYEPDLGERSVVDFEIGLASVQILLRSDDDPDRKDVSAHLCQGVANLVLARSDDPVEMFGNGASASLPSGSEIRVYLTRPGDSLSRIAGRFGMPKDLLATLNELDAQTVLLSGQPLKVVVFGSHDLTLDDTPRPPAYDALLLDQIRMVDGSPVPAWMVRDFAAEVVGRQPPARETVIGNDGIERLMVTVRFKLVSNHLEVRAGRFLPLVLTYAEKMNLDPALIMAIIHTESMFNPYARSDAPAYGLMQLVPHTAGREAYRAVYGRRTKLTAQYLYDPENNVELGAAYFSILKNRYMKSIADPLSRTYCAVAAYNAGASNVGKAFIAKKSIRQAIPTINRLDAQQVYDRLVAGLPMKESRNYVRKVLKRAGNYRHWH